MNSAADMVAALSAGDTVAVPTDWELQVMAVYRDFAHWRTRPFPNDETLYTKADYEDAVLELTNLVDAVRVRTPGDGCIVVDIRGVGGWTPGFLVRYVSEHLRYRCTVGVRIFVGVLQREYRPPVFGRLTAAQLQSLAGPRSGPHPQVVHMDEVELMDDR